MPNSAPTLSDFAAAITLGENTVNAAPQLLDADVTFNDADNNFDGGTLVVSGLLAEDRISIRDEGPGAGLIQFESGTGAVSFGGVVIGIATGGEGNTLTVSFNAWANSAAIEALIENLTYANVSNTPTASRNLTVEVTDAAGAGTRGAMLGFTEFTGASNPLAGIDVGYISAPALGDLDGDGDLDIVVGEANGRLFTITNTGTAATPVFGAPVQIASIDVGSHSKPVLGDLDGDGDLDIVVGDVTGRLFTITNTGTSAAPVFGALVEIAGIDLGLYSTPALGDLDGDGDLDIVVGNYDGQLFTITNTGTSAAPVFGAPVEIAGIDLGDFSTPVLGDLDGDGDLDIVAGNWGGQLLTITNTGTAATPLFGAPVQIAGIDAGSHSKPVLGDLDGDGDLDIVAGNWEGQLLTFLGSSDPHIAINVTAEQEAPVPAANAGLALNEGASGTISASLLDYNDAEQADVAITYTLDTTTTHGTLWLDANNSGARDSGEELISGESFTQADIGAGRLRYAHNGGETTGDGFQFDVSDGAGGTVSDQNFAITVTPVNDAPVLAANGGLTLAEGAQSAIGAALLDFNDVDNADAQITYTLDTTTTNGILWFDANDNGTLQAGEQLISGESFTQADIGAGRLRYTHNGGETTSDGFQFDVSDGAGGSIADQSFAITVTPVNDAPTLTGFAPSVALLENIVNATPQLLDADVSFGDPDNSFSGGTLVVSGLLTEDRVSIRDQGPGAGPIQFDSGTGAVSFGGVQIGTAAGGVGNTLTVTFNASATSAAIEALIENLTYANLSDTPTASRNLTVEVTDAAGAGTRGAALGFTTSASDPLAGVNASRLALGDLDGDGDLDIVVGESDGRLSTITNTGTAASPGFGARVRIAGIDVGLLSTPALGDLDDDGDLNIVAGNWDGTLSTITNTGTASVPNFAPPVQIAGVDLDAASSPTLGDLDGDGDLDIVVGDNYGRLFKITNTGTAASPGFGAPVQIAGVDVGGYSAPALGDLDGDGDLDIVVGDNYGRLSTITNTGTAASPGFGAPVQIAGIDVGSYSAPALDDLDGDGDLDIVTGEVSGTTLTFIGSSDPQVTVNVTAEQEVPVLGVNAGLTLNEGVQATIGAALLDYDDAEQADDAITYTLDNATANGALWLDANNNGTLQAGEELASGESFTQADIGAGRLRYIHNGGETTSDSFQFDLSDGAGGSVLNQTFAIAVTPVNDAPAGTNKTVTTKEDVAYVLKAADFGFSDVDGHGLTAVRFTTLPGAGKLTNNGAALGVGTAISIADINAGKLKFTPAKDMNGLNHASLTFQVKDNGGTANGGIDLDQSPNKITINVTAVLDVFTGTAAANNLTGTNDGDMLNGLGGNDRISGLGGNDTITGGLGADRLTGGLGKDLFVFTSTFDSAKGQSGLVNGAFHQAQGSGLRDIIADFVHGQDDINLNAIDANAKVGGNQAFSWKGTGNFTGVAGQLIERLYNNAGTANDKTIVYGDINGDAEADFQIELTGLKVLSAGDFAL